MAGSSSFSIAAVRHIARAPELVRLLVLVLAVMALTLEIRDGQALDPRGAAQVSILSAPAALPDSVIAEGEPSAESNASIVHRLAAGVRAPALRPRVDDIWLVALFLAGLLVGLLGLPGWRPRVPLPAGGAAPTGEKFC